MYLNVISKLSKSAVSFQWETHTYTHWKGDGSFKFFLNWIFKMHFHKVSSLEWIYSLKIEDNLPNRNGKISHTFKETDTYKIIAKDF